MKYKLYSIYDRLSHMYGNPFVQINDACAVRYFSTIIKQSPDMPASDYDLVCLGEWEPGCGYLEALDGGVVLIKNGGELEVTNG